MGKVRNVTIKKFGRSIVEKYPDKFTQDYYKNKQILKELADINSKKLKNRIAGYITSLMSRSTEIVHEPTKEESIAEKAEKETKIQKQKQEVEEVKAEKQQEKEAKKDKPKEVEEVKAEKQQEKEAKKTKN